MLFLLLLIDSHGGRGSGAGSSRRRLGNGGDADAADAADAAESRLSCSLSQSSLQPQTPL